MKRSLNLDDIVDDIVSQRSHNTDPKDEVARQRNVRDARKSSVGVQAIRVYLNRLPTK